MHCYTDIDANDKTYLCFEFTYSELKIWYDNKSSIERMTKVYLPNKEEMIAAYPHLTEII